MLAADAQELQLHKARVFPPTSAKTIHQFTPGVSVEVIAEKLG